MNAPYGAKWRSLRPEEARALYEEATRAAFYFSEWRNNLLKYFSAFAAALAVAAEWLQQHHHGTSPVVRSEAVVAVPFIVGYAMSLLLCWMDYRNHLLLRIAHGVAASVEHRWGVGLTGREKWGISGGSAPSGFYSALAELQPSRRDGVWSRWQRWSSYSVTMLTWFGLATTFFAVGTSVTVVAVWWGRLLVFVAMMVAATLFTALTRSELTARAG